MSNELLATTTTGLTLYAVLLNGTGQAYNTATPGWEIIEADNWTDYDIALSESEAPGVYLGDMPAVVAGVYTYVVYSQAGASPATSDTVKGTGTLDWTGTAEAALGAGVDVLSVSGDAGAADALEAMLDGTGGVAVDLAKVTVTATGNDSAIVATGSGTGSGIKAISGADAGGAGIYGLAAGAATNGIVGQATSAATGTGIYGTGAAVGIAGRGVNSGGDGIYGFGAGDGAGLKLNAGTTGEALELVKTIGRYITAAAEAEVVAGVALEATLTAIKGAGWSDETLVAMDTVLDLLYGLLTNKRGEPAQGAPAASEDPLTKIDYLYTSWRNKKTQTATTRTIYDDAGTTALMKATDSDDGTTFTKGELGTGA